MPGDIRADVESDSSRDAASLFLDLVTEHLDDTRAGAGPVSTTRSVEEIASRFDEPLPRTGAPLGDIVRRIPRDVITDANHLTHPNCAMDVGARWLFSPSGWDVHHSRSTIICVR